MNSGEPACRAFSPQRIIDEIKNMTENYGTKGIYFVGDNFTINKKRTSELCRIIKENKLDIKWTCETRADLVNKELLVRHEVRRMPNHVLWQSNLVQTRFNRNSTRISISKKSNAHLNSARQVGIRTATSFMLGIPGETVEDMHATFKFAKSTKRRHLHV